MMRFMIGFFCLVLFAAGCDSSAPFTTETDIRTDRPGEDARRPLSPDSIAIRFVATDVDRLAGFEVLLQRGDDYDGRTSVDTFMEMPLDTTSWYFFPRRDVRLTLLYFWEARNDATCPCSSDSVHLESHVASWYTVRIANTFAWGITNRRSVSSRADEQVIDSLGGQTARLRFHNGNAFPIDSLRVVWQRTLFQQRIEPGESTPYMDMPGLDRWPRFTYRVGLHRVEYIPDDTPDFTDWPAGWYTIPLDTLHWHGGRLGGYPTALWIKE